MTITRPIIPAFTIVVTTSLPKVGPIVFSWNLIKSTGRLPDLINTAIFWASCTLSIPLISALPSEILSLTTGAIITSSSNIIAICLPIKLAVANSNLFFFLDY